MQDMIVSKYFQLEKKNCYWKINKVFGFPSYKNARLKVLTTRLKREDGVKKAKTHHKLNILSGKNTLFRKELSMNVDTWMSPK